MLYYSLFTYALLCAALVLGALSVVRMIFGVLMQPTTRFFLSCCAFGLSFVPIQHQSLVVLLYSIFDTPSFLLLFICFFSVLRTFVNQIGFIIGYRGFLFIGITWLLFAGNAFGILDFAYGALGYKILLVGCIIAAAYCIDRTCGFFMLLSLLLWLPLAHTLDLYNAVFDGVVALFGWAMQSMPLYHNNFHVALLKPKIK